MAGESQLTPKSEPDPSVLTTEQILRAVHAERDYIDAQFAVRDERLRGIDRATELLNESVNRFPTDVQKEIGHLRELTAVELASIALQFKERDTRSERESRDNKVAVDAAFAAQKEAAAKQDEANQKAIDKSEKATSETIDKNAVLSGTQQAALVQQLADLKDRVTSIEQSRLGGREQRTDQRAASGALYAAVGFVISLVLAAIVLAGFAAAR